jgi:hypothetical protein
MDTSCSHNGQISTPERYYEIPPTGNRNPERPLKRLLDCYIGTEASHKAYVSEGIMMITFKTYSKKILLK